MTAEDVLLGLANDIAAAILPLEDILQRHGLTPAEYDTITRDPRFLRLLQSAVAEWTSVNNTTQRVRIKSQVAVEMALPDLYRTVTDPSIPLHHRAAMLRMLASLGKLIDTGGEPANTGNRGQEFSISITINGATKRFDGFNPPPTIDAEADTAATPALTEQ
jgi:hypothetical protein